MSGASARQAYPLIAGHEDGMAEGLCDPPSIVPSRMNTVRQRMSRRSRHEGCEG